jgi:hypothetical protein
MGISIENYNANRGIYSPLVEHNGIICGYWLCGNDYRNKSGYYGAYPPSFLKRIKLLFPDVENVLHIFAGKTPRGTFKNETMVDSNPNVNPDLCFDVEHIFDYLQPGATSFILADPPYDENQEKYHEKYGAENKKVNKNKVVRECAKILKIGGYLVWLDTIIPMWAKADGYKLIGTIALNQSTNHKTRTITILEKIREPEEGR